jgi:hypothetical protein
VEVPGGKDGIDRLPLCRQVRTDSPELADAGTAQRHTPGDEWRLREVVLRQEQPDGRWLGVRLLCDGAWLGERGAEVGGRLWLDLPEAGARGWARVLEVNPCPPLPHPLPGYRLVTGCFEYSSGAVYELAVRGEARAIRVTATHPLWSVDRGEWVQVKDLRRDERLLASDGSTPGIESLVLREQAERVYNIEVEGDHCYRVGQQGLLVHNQSNPCVHFNLRRGQSRVETRRERRFAYPNIGRNPTDPSTFGKVLGPPIRFSLWIVDRVVANLPLSTAGNDADAEIRWAIAGDDNDARIGVFVAPGDARNDTVGHIVGNQFGGQAHHDDNGRRNVFPQTQRSQGEYNSFEQGLARFLAANPSCEVCLEVVMRYGDDTNFPDRPTSFLVRFYLGRATTPNNGEGDRYANRRAANIPTVTPPRVPRRR